jgi:hypothetical protein
MIKHDPANGVFVDSGWQFGDLVPNGCQTGAKSVPELTPLEWLALLPGVVAQLEPERHEEFVAQILRACDLAGVELAGCMCDEFIVAKNWM